MISIEQRYQIERDRIELTRNADWSSFETQYTVAGEVLGPMTVQTWIDLLVLKSPVLYGEALTLETVVDYLWRHSKRRTENRFLRFWRLFWIERRVARGMRRYDMEMLRVLIEHANASLEEYPSGGAKSNSVKRSNTMPGISGPASMVDEIANRYSLHPDEVLNMPLRRAFSLQRVIRIATVPDYQLAEPESLRKIKSEYLNNLNNGEKRN